jgi:PhnB protein
VASAIGSSQPAHGGRIELPLQDMFWGAKFGMLTDAFGVSWMFNCDKKR